jgi:hypothetical protein
MAEAKGSQQGGVLAGGLGGGFLGFVLGLIASGKAEAAPPEGNWPRLFNLLEAIAEGVARLVNIAEGFTEDEPTFTLKTEIKAGMVFVPQDPETLNGIIQAMRLKGLTMFSQTRLSWAIPFGVTTDFTLTLPLNYVDTRRFCLITSDFYDPAIILNIFVDGELATPQGVAITGPTTIDFGEFYVKHQDIRFSTANGTVVDAVMSLQIVTALMEKSFYDEFYSPLMSYMYEQLKEVVSGSI